VAAVGAIGCGHIIKEEGGGLFVCGGVGTRRCRLLSVRQKTTGVKSAHCAPYRKSVARPADWHGSSPGPCAGGLQPLKEIIEGIQTRRLFWIGRRRRRLYASTHPEPSDHGTRIVTGAGEIAGVFPTERDRRPVPQGQLRMIVTAVTCLIANT
jgi:hypothetical protein